MKRGWLLVICLLAGILVIGMVVFSRLFFTDLDKEHEVESTAKTQVKLALYDWTHNLEVQNVIKQYNESNPDYIEIVIMDISRDDYNDTLNMLMTSGEGPDVFIVDQAWLASYVNKKYLENLAPYLSQSEMKRYPQWSLDYARRSLFKGGIYFVPTSVETIRLIYRKDLFRRAGLDPERPPATFAELKNAAKQITDTGVGVQKYGFALPAGDNQHSFQVDLEMSNTYSGLNYYDYRTGRYDISVYLPWLRTMREIKHQGSMYPGESLLKRENALKQFAEGNIGMMYVTSKDYVKLHEYMTRGDWGVAMPPAINEKSRGAGALMMLPQSPLVVNSSAGEKTAAVKVWSFLQSPAFQTVLFQQALALPLVDGIMDHSYLQPQYGHFKDFYPTENDAIYPLSPQIMDQYDPNTVASGPRNSGDRPRMELYLQLITDQEQPMDQALQGETERLNQMLDIAATGAFFNLEDYIIRDFDPLHPLP
ncbi:ABC transporter substrate-binding protein [Paenibacillus wynnii]|uniref:ABC transporter substrate-binding protein n=1 Tax=Paenibacillus wynnii TaxID=268407 RepID=UPI00278D1CBF|nr:extracellular solute-binding protein [Paenibacillus wynnii]MDQ0194217.1 multiple sugar transport system substrate-binding protein [Paenibacillus wynnii]